jgi:uncharacterized protein (TIGR02118 family)
MVKLTVLYHHPTDPAAFESYYAATHMPLAGKMDVRRIETAKVTGAPDGSKPAFYRMAELYFDDAAHMQRSTAAPEAKAAVADIRNFASGGVTLLVSEVDG